ncbi:unnamed protein product, partial [Cylicostephanus goldi]
MKITEGIEKMGVVLGAAKSEVNANAASSPDRTLPKDSPPKAKTPPKADKEANKNAQKPKEPKLTNQSADEHSTMSAEEKKAQRAQKAAEKKARAEAAAAKKAAAAQKDTAAGSKEQKKRPDHVNNQKPKEVKGAAVSAKVENGEVNHAQNETNNHAPGKSALRSENKHQTAREVKFDLCANVVKSPSDDSIGSDVPVGPISECPDPPSTAHIHPAFLNLAVCCEQGMIDEVDSLCQSFISAFKEVSCQSWWT